MPWRSSQCDSACLAAACVRPPQPASSGTPQACPYRLALGCPCLETALGDISGGRTRRRSCNAVPLRFATCEARPSREARAFFKIRLTPPRDGPPSHLWNTADLNRKARSRCDAPLVLRCALAPRSIYPNVTARLQNQLCGRLPRPSSQLRWRPRLDSFLHARPTRKRPRASPSLPIRRLIQPMQPAAEAHAQPPTVTSESNSRRTAWDISIPVVLSRTSQADLAECSGPSMIFSRPTLTAHVRSSAPRARWLAAIVLATCAMVTSGCAKPDASSRSPEPGTSQSVTETANEVVAAMKAKDGPRLAGFVHPERGVRFSPYAFVDVRQRSRHVTRGGGAETLGGLPHLLLGSRGRHWGPDSADARQLTLNAT